MNTMNETTTDLNLDLNLILRKEEVKKFVNTIIFFRYGSDTNKIKEFLESLQEIQIHEDGIVLIDNHGERRDEFKRNGRVTLPFKFSNENLNTFQIVQSTIDPLDFTVYEEWWNM